MREQSSEHAFSRFGMFRPPSHVAKQWELSSRNASRKVSMESLEMKLEEAALRRQVCHDMCRYFEKDIDRSFLKLSMTLSLSFSLSFSLSPSLTVCLFRSRCFLSNIQTLDGYVRNHLETLPTNFDNEILLSFHTGPSKKHGPQKKTQRIVS